MLMTENPYVLTKATPQDCFFLRLTNALRQSDISKFNRLSAQVIEKIPGCRIRMHPMQTSKSPMRCCIRNHQAQLQTVAGIYASDYARNMLRLRL
jgi:hypothetical protein